MTAVREDVAATASPQLSAREAVERIGDGDTVAILGAGGGLLEPDLLLDALRERFLETGHPRDLTIVHSVGIGDKGDRGMTKLALPGLVRRMIGGHIGNSPAVGRLVKDGSIELYNLPLGVMGQLFRDTAAGRPGLLTKIGIGTFVDPRVSGPGLNARSTAKLVEVMTIDGEDYLFYRAIPVDFAFVRGTRADSLGNISFDDEPNYLDSLENCMAAARGRDGRRGTAFVQVKHVQSEPMHPKHVHIPAMLVGGVVEHPEQWQTYLFERDDVVAGDARIEESSFERMPFSWRKVIARRAADFVEPGDVVNLGVGVPDGVASILRERRMLDRVVMTNEQGVVGGVTSLGMIFGASRNYDSVIPMPHMMDLYQGGLLDIAFLGFAQADAEGNVNVSLYNGEIMGVGGFIDITQSARRVVFCGSLTAVGARLGFEGGRLRVEHEGSVRKLVEKVEHVSFSGPAALERGQRVTIVTERCVLELTPRGLELTEIAPGVDVQRDVIDQIGFPVSASNAVQMPATHFTEEG